MGDLCKKFIESSLFLYIILSLNARIKTSSYNFITSTDWPGRCVGGGGLGGLGQKRKATILEREYIVQHRTIIRPHCSHFTRNMSLHCWTIGYQRISKTWTSRYLEYDDVTLDKYLLTLLRSLLPESAGFMQMNISPSSKLILRLPSLPGW